MVCPFSLCLAYVAPVARRYVAPPSAVASPRRAARCNCIARRAARYLQRKSFVLPGAPRETGLTSSVRTQAGGIYSDIYSGREKYVFMHPVFFFFFLSNFVSRDETHHYRVVPVGISLFLISRIYLPIYLPIYSHGHSSASEPTLPLRELASLVFQVRLYAQQLVCE